METALFYFVNKLMVRNVIVPISKVKVYNEDNQSNIMRYFLTYLENYLKNLKKIYKYQKKYPLHNPCSIHLVQHILPGDNQKRVEFSEMLLSDVKKTKI